MEVTHAGGAAQAARRPGRSLVAALIRRRESANLLALVIIMAVIGATAPNFLSAGNLYLVSRQISFVAIVAFGELFVILTGGIDLSVGSLMALAGMAAAWAMKAGVAPPLAVAAGLAVGLAMGAVNGALISYVRIAPFIVTLGMLSLASGLVLGLTKGWPITEIPASFLPIAQGSFLGLPVPVWIALAIAIVAHVALTSTAFGRRTYAIGGNEQATFLSGIDVSRIKFALYMISAATASLAGIILVARFNSAQADTGKGWELDAIAAAVIGGTSLAGGSGSVLGVAIGACIMGVIKNGLVLMRVSSYWQTAIIGIIIVLAAVLDRLKSRRGA
ncbi:MAG TPA: ABC transporter permease [Anaeromyxobacteraceae bacterium]|nr:ABC transporter permease [Anaeromyxobacteraceae bacterium]